MNREITYEDVKEYCKPRCLTIIDNELLYELTHPKIKALEQEPSGDLISREDRLVDLANAIESDDSGYWTNKRISSTLRNIKNLPPVTPKTGHCKNCKYFEYDSVAKVDGIPLIVAHEICSRWGNGCKTKEDGYCFLFEPQESEEG